MEIIFAGGEGGGEEGDGGRGKERNARDIERRKVRSSAVVSRSSHVAIPQRNGNETIAFPD